MQNLQTTTFPETNALLSDNGTIGGVLLKIIVCFFDIFSFFVVIARYYLCYRSVIFVLVRAFVTVRAIRVVNILLNIY